MTQIYHLLFFTLFTLPSLGVLAQDSKAETTLSKETLRDVFDKYQNLSEKVFSKGSTVSDVNELYAFYTVDFQYNHPKYGGVYSKKLLYDNTVKYLQQGVYDNSKSKEIIKVITGLDVVITEWRYEGDLAENTKVTMFKFKGDRIYYIEEFW